MISDQDYDILYKKTYEEVERLLSQTDYDKFCEEMNPVEAEKLFWNLLKSYVEGKIPEHTMSFISKEFLAQPVHHNMSHEAQIALNESYKLEDLTYFRIDEEKAKQLRENLKEDVKNYFEVWYKNFE